MNMRRFNHVIVAADPKGFQRLPAGRVFGPIHLQVQDTIFPNTSWTDFAVIILHWWLEAITRSGLQTSTDRLAFMDGPYEFDLHKLGGEFEMRFFRTAAVVSEVPRVDPRSFLKSVVA